MRGIIRIDLRERKVLKKELPIEELNELVESILVHSLNWGLESKGEILEDFDIKSSLKCFMDLFENWRMKPKHEWDSIGREKFEAGVREFMESGKPIAMLLPAFPFKSPNPKKTIAGHFDMAEKLALEKIHNFCESVKRFYPPGVAFVLVSDGRVYNSQFEISLESVLSFQQAVKENCNSEYITIVGLEDFFPRTSVADKRDVLLRLFGQTIEFVKERIKNDPDFNRVYCGFKHFMMEELHFPHKTTWKIKRDKSSEHAKEMMRSNDVYGRLLECLFPHHIRLSIHPHSNVSKVGIQMTPIVPGADFQWGTPWHNCALLRKNGEWQLIRKNMAMSRGYKLIENGSLPYYLETELEHETLSQVSHNGNTIYIENVPSDADEQQFLELISRAGKITNVNFDSAEEVRSPNYFKTAQVTFDNFNEALWAVENLNGISFTGVMLRIHV